MTAPDSTAIAVEVQCGRCATAYWLQHGEAPGLATVTAEQLAGLVLPMALQAGWEHAEDQTLRCPRCVEEHGLAPVERVGWREWLYGLSVPPSGAAPDGDEGAG